MKPAKVCIVFDGVAWFTRRVRVIEHDLDRDEKVYRCDKHLGGPFRSAMEAVGSLAVPPAREQPFVTPRSVPKPDRLVRR